MPREKQDYRPYLEDLLAFTNGRRIMTAKEAMAYTGKSRHWLANKGLTKEVGVVQLARIMAMLGKEEVR